MAADEQTAYNLEDVSPFKLQVYYALEEPTNGNFVAKFFSAFLVFLVAVNLVLVFIDTDGAVWGYILPVFDGISFTCFGIEYFLRIWTAPLLFINRTPAKARLRYIFSVMGIIDLVSFLPGILPFLFSFDPRVVKALRIVRVIRVFKLTRYMEGFTSIKHVFSRRRYQIFSSLALLALMLIVSATLMYQMESDAQPDVFYSVWVSFYWAITTITNTGYGDIVPITIGGRILAFLVMALSIAFVAVPVAVLSAGFVEESRQVRRHPGITIHATEKLSYLENNGKLIKEERDGRNAQESTLTDAERETLREQRATGVEGDEDIESQERPRFIGAEASPDAAAGYVTCCDAARAFGRGSFSYCPYCGRTLYPDESLEEQD